VCVCVVCVNESCLMLNVCVNACMSHVEGVCRDSDLSLCACESR